MQLDANNHVPLAWPNNIFKYCAMMLIHKQEAKQKYDDDGNSRKKE